MTAAETGHVVYSTLHTINAGQTINRILGMFTPEEEPQLRQRLAETLRYVVSQRLVSKIGGGRLMVSEIMGNSLRTRETILYGESENKTSRKSSKPAPPRGGIPSTNRSSRPTPPRLITRKRASSIARTSANSVAKSTR